jgi:phage terminase small subunit
MSDDKAPSLLEDAASEAARLHEMFGDAPLRHDALVIELLSVNVALWRRSMADVDRLGQVVMSGGMAIANPNIAVADRALSKIRDLLDDIGATATIKRRMASLGRR